MIKPHQYQHYANGIARIRQCIQNCKEPATVRGTVFSERDTHDPALFFNYVENRIKNNILNPFSVPHSEFRDLIDVMGFDLTEMKGIMR